MPKPMFRVMLVGGSTLPAKLGRLRGNARRTFVRELRASGNKIRDDARAAIHNVSGKTARGIVVEVDTEKLDCSVTSKAPSSIILELGSRAHLIRPRRKKALRFEVDGKVVFTKLVHHPGTKPHPFLMPAFLKERRRFMRRIQVVLKRAMRGEVQ